MNQELRTMFEADQSERGNHPSVGTPEYVHLRERDAQRRQRVREMMAEGRPLSAGNKRRRTGPANHEAGPVDHKEKRPASHKG